VDACFNVFEVLQIAEEVEHKSNPQVMAGLTCFGTDANSKCRPTGYESKSQIIRDAIRRSEGVVIFYHGLKAFAGDPAGQGMIDNMIEEENRYIRLLGRLSARVQGASEGSASPVLSFGNRSGQPHTHQYH